MSVAFAFIFHFLNIGKSYPTKNPHLDLKTIKIQMHHVRASLIGPLTFRNLFAKQSCFKCIACNFEIISAYLSAHVKQNTFLKTTCRMQQRNPKSSSNLICHANAERSTTLQLFSFLILPCHWSIPLTNSSYNLKKPPELSKLFAQDTFPKISVNTPEFVVAQSSRNKFSGTSRLQNLKLHTLNSNLTAFRKNP